MKDHPRPCGEKPSPLLFARREPGSPPPMRGKDVIQWPQRVRTRITPAHAGKSLPKSGQSRTQKDHPRPCGEKCFFSGGSDGVIGSPPPMRGKEFDWMPNAEAARITPAHAGKSCLYVSCRYMYEDHPRPCGEKLDTFDGILRPGGSPPPMRGKGYRAFSSASFARITPAHAGKRFFA